MKKKIAMGVLSASTIAITPIIVAVSCGSAKPEEMKYEEKIRINSAKLFRNFLKEEQENVNLYGGITLTHAQVKEFFGKPENIPVHKNNQHMQKWKKTVLDKITIIKQTDAFQGVKEEDSFQYPYTFNLIEDLDHQCPITYWPLMFAAPVKNLLVNWIRNFNESLTIDQKSLQTKFPLIPETLNANKYYDAAMKEFKTMEKRKISFKGMSFENDKEKVKIFKDSLKQFYKNFYIEII